MQEMGVMSHLTIFSLSLQTTIMFVQIHADTSN